MRCLLRFALSYQVYAVAMAIPIQPCVEVTFLAIFSEFQKTVQPIVMDMLKKVQGIYLSGVVFSLENYWMCHCVYRERYLGQYPGAI